MLDELKTAEKVVGIKQLRKALAAGKAKTVFIAEDADPLLTEPIVRRARLDGKRIAAPRVLGETMEFFWLTPETKLELSGYGIPEPVNGERAGDRTALVLMPGLAFDPAGNRLGYGGGFYDRFLAREPEHPTIALCYGFQLLPRLEVESHDRPVDAVISEPII